MPTLRHAAFAILVPLTALAACDELDPDPATRQAAREQRSCLQAVERHTGQSGAMLNTTLPVIEIQQLIVDLPKTGGTWTCYTDASGQAIAIKQTRMIPTAPAEAG